MAFDALQDIQFIEKIPTYLPYFGVFPAIQKIIAVDGGWPVSLTCCPTLSPLRKRSEMLRSQDSRFHLDFPNAIGGIFMALVVGVLAFRITRGVDFSDESYYALFLDDWLKGGISHSSYRTAHQTAALIVYPAAWIYQEILGTRDGLFLFLRLLNLTGAAISSFIWIQLIFRLKYRELAWLAGIFVVSFIPFGLPAPSYNTLAEQGLLVGLGAFACGHLAQDQFRAKLGWSFVSACGWALAVVAYPSMIVPYLLFCAICLVATDDSYAWRLLQMSLGVGAIVCGWLVVVCVMTPQRLSESFAFSGTDLGLDGIKNKLTLIWGLLTQHAGFAVLSLAAITIGLFRRTFPVVTSVALAVVISMLWLITPALYLRSHDAVCLLALGGLGALSGLRSGKSSSERSMAIIYGTSMCAALVMTATTANPLFNFPIAVLPAAVVALLSVGAGPRTSANAVADSLLALVTITGVLSISVSHYYGEVPSRHLGRVQISHGFFSGLSVLKEDAELLDLVESKINPILRDDDAVAVVGRLPGLALAMPTRLGMPNSYPLSTVASHRQVEKQQAFYEQAGRLPSIVVTYKDPYFDFVMPIRDFAKRYEMLWSIQTERGKLELFQRLDRSSISASR